MKEKNKVFLKTRGWLRPNNSWGADTSFYSDVELYMGRGRTKNKKTSIIYRSISGSFRLRDCTSTISLDLDADSNKHYKARLRVVARVMEEVTKTRDAGVGAHKELKQRGAGMTKDATGDTLCT